MNLGDVVFRLGDDKAAKPYYARAVSILEEASPDNPELARFLDRLATVTLRQGDVSGAQRLYERSLALREKVLGPKHHDVAGSLGGLAECARRHGREREAEALYERSLELCRRPDGGYYVGTDYILDGYSALLDTLGQKTRAAEMKALAVKLRQNGP
jgi:tetratricopeptide (TPR) repeat protein